MASAGTPEHLLATPRALARRRFQSKAFKGLCLVFTWFCLVLLAVLLVHATRQGIKWLDWGFLTEFPSRMPERAGIKSALYGTLWLIGLTGLFSIPVGVGAAIYLEEYARPTRLNAVVDISIANLAGVPSVVYGILGLAVFVRWFSLGPSVLAGALTMSLLILPIIIVASREALRSVPDSIRRGAYALGATQWQTTRHHVLPSALPGILTGTILALSRALGETAPLILVGAAAFVAFVPSGPMDSFTALPIQIYGWVGRPQEEFRELAAAGIVVLLTVLLLMNATAVIIRQRAQRTK